MNIFNIDEDKMKELSSTFTLKEIYQQPTTWLKTLAQIKESKKSLQDFINQLYQLFHKI